jgi:signal transduction histidine kinase
VTGDRDELRTLFLFESLSDEQLDFLLEQGEFRTYDADTVLSREGDPAEYLFVLVEGGIRLTRLANGEELLINETTQRGVYSGAVRSYVQDPGPYVGTVVTTAPSRMFRLPGEAFAELVQRWFPMALHLLDGLWVGVRSSEAQVRQREHLVGLGVLSANLAHELNNPAAATVRAAEQLRSRVAGMRHKLGMVASGALAPRVIAALVELQEAAVERAAKHDAVLTPMEVSDAEDELADHLESLGVTGGFDLAPVFVQAGLDTAWVDEVAATVAPEPPEGALRWLAYTLETEALMDEIEDASTRISALVAAVKDYSHMDQAGASDVDVHKGLDSTLVMLGTKLARLTVLKEYDRTLPQVPAWPAELNQVWTNLLDNAAYAARSTVTVRTRRDGDAVLVEVCDDGPGIPEDVLPRVFDAFFTTKPAGEGSGLGLDAARRIVEQRHGGTLAASSSDAGAVFTVRLPLTR